MDDKIVILGGISYTIFSEFVGQLEFFGWYETAKFHRACRFDFCSYESACNDLANHVRYCYGIQRNVSEQSFK